MRTVMATFLAAFLLAACGGDAAGSEAFCEATRKVVDLGDVEEVPPEVQTMVDEAPDEIKDSAETVQAAFEDMFENQDPSAIQTEEFQDAAKELREYAVDNCKGLEDITNE